MARRRGLRLGVVALACLSAPAAGQQPRPLAGQDPLSRAIAAEQRGDDSEAAVLYRSVLGSRPAQLQALLGADRVLQNLGRSAELLPIVVQAVTVDSTTIGVLNVAVRVFARAGMADSARRYAIRWAAGARDDEAPWREWSQSALEGRDLRSAKLALEEGRRRLGPGALAPDLAQLLQLEGDYAGATLLWLTLLETTPSYRNGALVLLGQAPPPQRGVVRETVLRHGTLEGRRLLALLQVRWGEAETALGQLLSLLPGEPAQAVALLESLRDELGSRGDPVAQRVRGRLHEAIAERQEGAAAAKSRLAAARAYADGGDERNARRMLTLVAADANAPPGTATGASSALLGVLIVEGKAAEAEAVLARLAPSLELDQRDRDRRRIAMAWARHGEFERADALVAGDSSVAGFDLRGRLRLYRGDLASASLLLKEAGPIDDDRELAVARVTILALMQAVGRDSLPALGAALLDLERGDSLAAMGALTSLADGLSPAGAAEARLLAARIAAAQGDSAVARRLLLAADTTAAPATAPAARLALAGLAAAAGQVSEATALLERLLLEFPGSAVAPDARQLRDALRRAASRGGTD